MTERHEYLVVNARIRILRDNRRPLDRALMRLFLEDCLNDSGYQTKLLSIGNVKTLPRTRKHGW